MGLVEVRNMCMDGPVCEECVWRVFGMEKVVLLVVV